MMMLNSIQRQQYANAAEIKAETPHLAFLGAGWIGRNRMQSIHNSGLAEIRYIVDPSEECLAESFKINPDASFLTNFEQLLEKDDFDGLIIATPSAMHAEQTVRALEKGIPVFCQKPLGRNFIETSDVVNAARLYNRLLGLDLSYRFTKAYEKIIEIINAGEIGKIFSVDLVFHNAYGPGKQWFYDLKLSGGGCVIDLGIHLIDLALFALGFPEVKKVDSKIYSQGNLLKVNDNVVEDYAAASIELENGITLLLNCSWNLSAGKQAIIEASFHGTSGGVSLKNINGSYYDFIAEFYQGTKTSLLCAPPDDWGGRAAVDWVKHLAIDKSFNESAEQFTKTASVLDRIYGRM